MVWAQPKNARALADSDPLHCCQAKELLPQEQPQPQLGDRQVPAVLGRVQPKNHLLGDSGQQSNVSHPTAAPDAKGFTQAGKLVVQLPHCISMKDRDVPGLTDNLSKTSNFEPIIFKS